MQARQQWRWLTIACVLAAAIGGQSCPVAVDINTASESFSSDPRMFCRWNGQGYFVASTIDGGDVVYRSDGTEPGTRPVHDPVPGSDGEILAFGVHGSGRARALWLVARSETDAGLWRGDGVDFRQVSTASRGHKAWLGSFDDTILVSTRGGLFAFRPGSTHLENLSPTILESLDTIPAGPGEALVIAQINSRGHLWRTDGTPTGTVKVASFNRPIHGVTRLNDRWILAESLLSNQTLWTTDGTGAGTNPIPSTQGTVGSFGGHRSVLGRFAYFSNYRVGSGYQLWRTDGTDAGTKPFFELPVDWRGSMPHGFLPREREIWFLAKTRESGTVVFGTDGSPGRVRLVYDPDPNRSDKPVGRIRQRDRDVVFDVDTRNGQEWHIARGDPHPVSIAANKCETLATGLWLELPNGRAIAPARRARVAETELALRLVSGVQSWLDLEPARPTGHSDPRDLTVVGRTLWFSAYTPKTGREPWIFADGRGRRVADIAPGPASSGPSSFVGFLANGKPLTAFKTWQSNNSHSLWVSDNTPSGTRRVSAFGNVTALRAATDRVYFTIDDQQLWQTDGTPAGTRRIHVPRAGAKFELTLHATWDSRLVFDIGGDDFWLAEGDPAKAEAWTLESVSGPRAAQTIDNRLILDATTGSFLAEDRQRIRRVPLGTAVPVHRWIPHRDSVLAVQADRARVFLSTLDREQWTLTAFHRLRKHDNYSHLSTGTLGRFLLIASGGAVIRHDPHSGHATTLLDQGDHGVQYLHSESAGNGAYAFVWPGRRVSNLAFLGPGKQHVEWPCRNLWLDTQPPSMVKADGRLFFATETLRYGRELHWIPEPRANVTDLGHSCVRGASIRSTDPVLGRDWTVRGHQSAGPLRGVLLLGQSTRHPQPAAWNPACLSWLDPRQPVVAIATIAGTRWSAKLHVPNDPRLKHRRLAAQAVFAPGSRQARATSSNTMLLMLSGE